MAGQWLCTNECRCVDGGRTSLVTVLISGCAQGVISTTLLLQEGMLHSLTKPLHYFLLTLRKAKNNEKLK